MAYIFEDRVLETSTSTGSGDLTLAGALIGYRAFSAVCTVGDTFHYMIEAIDGYGAPSGDWETGVGTYSAANTLTRTTVRRSSNANAAVSFDAGTKRVALSINADLLNRPARGALVVKTADQTTADYTTATAITWDQNIRDTDGFHSTSVNPSRITIPAGVTKVRLSYCVLATSVTASLAGYAQLRKNGSNLFDGNPHAQSFSNQTDPRLSATSAILDVTTGDYFEVFFNQLTDASITIEEEYSWFAIEVVEETRALFTNPAGLVLIAEYDGDGTQNSYTFSSIPTEYSDLILAVSGRSTNTSQQVFVTVNGLSTSIYDRQRVFAQNATVTADEALAQTSWGTILGVTSSSATTSFSAGGELTIYGYAQTTLHKAMTAIARQINSFTTGNGYVVTASGCVRTTEAISSVTVALTAANNFASGSLLRLYGRR